MGEIADAERAGQDGDGMDQNCGRHQVAFFQAGATRDIPCVLGFGIVGMQRGAPMHLDTDDLLE
ncbi:MAG: hypothetical protein OXH79_14205 [Boseongicola sp.]|nr:hypothetical protein [Boseongicola sp.]